MFYNFRNFVKIPFKFKKYEVIVVKYALFTMTSLMDGPEMNLICFKVSFRFRKLRFKVQTISGLKI